MTSHELANMLLQMPDVQVQIPVPNTRGLVQPITGLQIITASYWEPQNQHVIIYGAYYNFLPKER